MKVLEVDRLPESEESNCGWEIELDRIPDRVTPGQYTVECLKVSKIVRKEWRRTYLQFRFRLRGMGPENMVELPGFANFPRGKCSAFSKLGRWTRIVAAYTGGRSTRVSLKQFGEFLFTVNVETVQKANSRSDRKPFTLPEAAQYEVVSEILGIVGRLTKPTVSL